MKIMKLIFSLGIAGALLAIIMVPAYAQIPGIITAEVDRNSISTDGAVLLTITIDASQGNPGQPTLPALEGFTVVSTSSGTQIMLINGEMSVNATYEYWLRPVRAGTLVIEPVSVVLDGQLSQTQPISIQVTQGTGQNQALPAPNSPAMPAFPSLPGFPDIQSLFGDPFSQGGRQVKPLPNQALTSGEAPAGLNGQDFFVSATIDKLDPYQGEQVLYTVRFYQAVELPGDIQYQSPSFTGFWHELLPEELEYMIEAGGRPYRVTEIQTVLYPSVNGDLTIDPATLVIPGGFFSRGQILATEPINVVVQPLPPNAPEGYQGAVGRYLLRAEADELQTQVNDTVTLYVLIEGQGNIQTLGDLPWQNLPGWRAFESQMKDEAQFLEGQMNVKKLYTRVLVPTETGDYTLPVIEFSYFDPEIEAYQTLYSDPIAVHVQPDPNNTGEIAPVSASQAATDTSNDVPQLRPLKPAPATWKLNSQNTTDQPLYWAMWALPVLIVAGQLSWEVWNKKKKADPARRRSKRAAANAYRRLDQIEKKDVNAAAEIPLILSNYMNEKLNLPISGLTHAELAATLQDHGADQETITCQRELFMFIESGRFTPNSSSAAGSELLQETRTLIGRLEKSIHL